MTMLSDPQRLHIRLETLGIKDPQERRAFVCFVAGCPAVASLNDLDPGDAAEVYERFRHWSDEKVLVEIDAWLAAVALAAFEALPSITVHDLTSEQTTGTLFDRKVSPSLGAAQRARLVRETAEATAKANGRTTSSGSGVDWVGAFAAGLEQLDDGALIEKAQAFEVETP